jgi:hypothetical protein
LIVTDRTFVRESKLYTDTSCTLGYRFTPNDYNSVHALFARVTINFLLARAIGRQGGQNRGRQYL